MTSEKVTQPSAIDFSAINKLTSQSFISQKKLIKNIGNGRRVNCPHCQQALQLRVPSASTAESVHGIFCPKGCTDIHLSFES